MWIISLTIALVAAILGSYFLKLQTKHHSHVIYLVSFITLLSSCYYLIDKLWMWFNQTAPNISINDLIDKLPADNPDYGNSLGDVLKDSQYSPFWKKTLASRSASTQGTSSATASAPVPPAADEVEDGVLY